MKFDITEYLKSVFPFQQADADKCFLHFEKVASNLKWPTDYWVIQLQSTPEDGDAKDEKEERMDYTRHMAGYRGETPAEEEDK